MTKLKCNSGAKATGLQKATNKRYKQPIKKLKVTKTIKQIFSKVKK